MVVGVADDGVHLPSMQELLEDVGFQSSGIWLLAQLASNKRLRVLARLCGP